MTTLINSENDLKSRPDSLWLRPLTCSLLGVALPIGLMVLIGSSSFGIGAEVWQAEFPIARQGRFVIVDGIIGNEAAKLLVDTGSMRTGLDQRFVSQLGESTGQLRMAAFGRPVDVTLHHAPLMRLEKCPVNLKRDIYTRDFSAERKGLGQEFWGVLGSDAFQNFVIQFDFDRGVMRVASELPEEVTASLGTKLQMQSDAIGRTVIEGTIGDEREKFQIGTGSNTTCLRADLFDRLRREGKLESGREKSVIVPGGLTLSQTGLLHEPRFGNHVHDEIVCDRAEFSSLGLRYLSRYLVTIDYPNRTLYLKPGKTYSRKARRGFTGISAIKDRDSFVVTRIQPGSPAESVGMQLGDRILKIDDQSASDLDMFQMGLILTTNPGTRLKITISREGQRHVVTLIEQDRFSEIASSDEFPPSR